MPCDGFSSFATKEVSTCVLRLASCSFTSSGRCQQALMGPRLCHLQGRQLRQKLHGRKPPQCVGRLVWKYLGGDCVGDLLLNVHRESKRLLEQRVLELYKFRMTARCFQRFAHQPLSIVERTRQQFLGLSLVTEPPDILPGGHENTHGGPALLCT